MLIDKALSYAIDVILMRPDLFDDFVDNELRIFLLDTAKVCVQVSHSSFLIPDVQTSANIHSAKSSHSS